MQVIFSSIHFERRPIKSKSIVEFLSNRFDSISIFRLNEHRDFFNEIKSRLDFEREDRRLVESQLASK